MTTSIFKNFDSSDIVSGRIQSVSTGLWSNNAFSQSAFYVSNAQVQNIGTNNYSVGNGIYYWDIYNLPNPDSDVQSEKIFSVAYGHKDGSGSGEFDVSTTKIFPTKAVYSQYKNILLMPEDIKFTFVTGSSNNPASLSTVDSDDVYVINFATEKYKDRLDYGQFQINVKGPNGEFKFIDDSSTQANTGIAQNKSVFNIVSGTLSSGVKSDQNGSVYNGVGLFYPSVGIVILNPSALSSITGLSLPVTSSTNLIGSSSNTRFSSNQSILMFGTAGATASAVSNPHGITSITARSTEYVPSRHFFVRVKNQEFNYSNNPTYVQTGSNAGKLRYDSFIENPVTYITTVGLYNDENDLLAVAKLSQPYVKTFDNEALIKIKISW